MNLPLLPPQPSCRTCDLHTQARSVGVPSRWLPTSLPPDVGPYLFFLGRNPGFHEDEKNECFVGRSGALLLEGYIEPLSLHRHATIILGNACRCYTTDNTPPNFPRAMRPCFQAHTLPELHALSQRGTLFVVCLGAETTAALLRISLGRKAAPQKTAFASNGHLLTTTSSLTPPFSFIHLSTYHPAAIDRASREGDGTRLSQYIFAVDSHMALLHRLLTGSRPLSVRPAPRWSPSPAGCSSP